MASLSISRFAKIVPAKDAIRTWKIKSGDKVIVRCGSHRGKVGKIIQTDHLRNMVRIEGVNTFMVFSPTLKKKVAVERKIHYSNVALLDPSTLQPTKVKFLATDDDKMIRISKSSGLVLPWPETVNKRPDFAESTPGPKDTSPQLALEVTYDYQKDKEALRIARQSMNKYNRDRD